MFLSNTSTTLMILPSVQAIVNSLEEGGTKGIGKPLMLSVAYAASCGGLGTLIGTPPNGVLAGIGTDFGLNISFAKWMAFASPLALVMILMLWVLFITRFKVPFKDLPSEHPVLTELNMSRGTMSQAEFRT